MAMADGSHARRRHPAVAIIKMCYSGKYTEREMYDRITKNGGLVDHLGTADVVKYRNASKPAMPMQSSSSTP